MTRYTLSPTLASILLAACAVSAAELQVEPDKENVVASRLEGNWQPHNSLTQRLTGKAKSRPRTLSFKSDPSVAGMIPGKYAEFFNEHKTKIYLAGYVDLQSKVYPFVLIQFHGNPNVVYWRERDGDPFGNGESFNVMLAVAKDQQNDLLFVGGDFNNQSFSPFERAPVAPKN